MARLARNVFVGDLKEDFFITVRIIRMLPETPRQKVKLKTKHIMLRLKISTEICTKQIFTSFVKLSMLNFYAN